MFRSSARSHDARRVRSLSHLGRIKHQACSVSRRHYASARLMAQSRRMLSMMVLMLVKVLVIMGSVELVIQTMAWYPHIVWGIWLALRGGLISKVLRPARLILNVHDHGLRARAALTHVVGAVPGMR